jgi:hypothetical protein
MSNIVKKSRVDYGYDFIEDSGAGELLRGAGELLREDSLRNKQLCGLYHDDKRVDTYTALTQDEVDELKANGCRSYNWNDVKVRRPFDTDLVRNCFFAGLVRIGSLEQGILRFHDYSIPVGLCNSRIIASDIGDNAAVVDCHYIAHYITGDRVILSCINEMDMSNHSKFGEGLLREGEDEELRVWIEPLNETGGRRVLPFKGMLTADAWLWTMFREDAALMDSFKRITTEGTDELGIPRNKRGYYGTVGHDAVIKHCLTIKDARFGDEVYVKGANKLKNITVCSDSKAPTQIGEGVELVNGIIGYGCRVFYGCKAVRFVLGSNCNLKYGARLIHSILGDNSTVSCCEILNNLVFPFHEQHHNNSFLIATMIMGQSNLAAGATVGSNHNSRGNDGEIIAGRGFWPGLSSTLKHNCRFASFLLIAKGNYPCELNIPLPFSLLTTNPNNGHRELMPAYWWMHNMYALERNSWKFHDRDKRVYKRQHIETNYLAPDTVAEIIKGLSILEAWGVKDAHPDDERKGAVYAPPRTIERSPHPIRIIKAAQGYASYRDMLTYYAVKTLLEYFEQNGGPAPESFERFQDAHKTAVSFVWYNMGGQLTPEAKLEKLKTDVKNGSLASWDDVHKRYDELWAEYPLDKALNALQVLRFLETGDKQNCAEINAGRWQFYLERAARLRSYIEEQVYKTKLKDYTDPFRMVTYRNETERDAVLGKLENNSFVLSAREDSKAFLALVKKAQ